MKKLITIFYMALMSCGAFGQSKGNVQYVKDTLDEQGDAMLYTRKNGTWYILIEPTHKQKIFNQQLKQKSISCFVKNNRVHYVYYRKK